MCSSLQVLYLIEGEAEGAGFVPFFSYKYYTFEVDHGPPSTARWKKSIK
jgi:hypothetical protein